MQHAFTRGQLFHYTTKERAIEYIFHGMTIRMGSMRATNDPRETDPWFFGWIMDDNESGPDGEDFFEVNRKIDEILKRSCLVACFTGDAPDPHPEFDPDLYAREDLGLQGYEHDRMWAQYVGNHAGVCILFDRDELVRRMEEHFRGRPGRLLHGPVDYDSEIDLRNSPFYELSWKEMRQMGVEAYARQHGERFARQLYMTKSPDWVSEQEYRFVWIGEGEDEDEAEYVPIKGCVSAVCLGARFPEVYETNMRAIKERLGIDVYKIHYSYGKLRILPVGWDPPAPQENTSPTPA